MMRTLHCKKNRFTSYIERISGRHGRRFISLLLCLCMIMSLMCSFGESVLSDAASPTAEEYIMNRIADGDTTDAYDGKLLSEEWGSRYAGRVWTDKSVFSYGTPINLDTETDGYNGNVNFNSDFGTIFSALSSSQRINEYPPSPVDLVILIDMSGSMAADIVCGSSQTHDDFANPNGERITHSRIYAVLESINSTIQQVMDMGEADRVAVVAYGATAYTLLELGHYETKTNGKYLEVKNFRNYYNNNKQESNPANSGSASYMVGTVEGLKKLDKNGATYSDYKRYVRNDYKETEYSCDPDGTVNIGFHTNLQAGIYQGFEELYKNYNSKDDVTETYESADTGAKTVVQRIPVAIVTTDGGSNYALQPTAGATGDEWHDVPIYDGNVTAYTGAWEKYRTEATGNDRGGNATILDILMTAAYEKAKVQKKYAQLVQEARTAKELQDDRFKGTEFRILTLSIDTPTNEWQKPRVYAALDPKHFFNSDLQPNNGINPNTWTQKQDVIDAYHLFEQWQAATDSITVSFKDSDSPNRNIKFNRLPDLTDPIAVTNDDVVNNINYNTRFADISSAALTDTFDEMLNEVRGIAFTPLSGDNASGVADSITYQDPLGEYMELKNGSITVDGDVTGSTEKTFDMSMLLFGEMHGLVRAGVYDYQWNNDYMRNNEEKPGYPEKNVNPDETPLRIGWYKGDAETAEYSYDSNTGLPHGCSTAADAWAQGWVLRFNYKTLAEFVPISGITDDMLPTQVPEQIKHAVYTCYRFADSQEERNRLRRNPIFGAVPDDLQKEWKEYFDTHGSYPVGMDFYSGYSGVYRLSDIRVWTEHTGDFVDQTGAITPEEEGGYDDSLYVNIPVSAVPTQLAEITLGGEGPISYKDNLRDKKQSTPLRLFYAVGLTEDLIQRDADGNQTGVDISKISGEYIASHSDPETNNIYFISNWYSNTAYRGYTSDEMEEYRTRGDAAVTFSPNAKNRYYLFQKALPLIAHAYRVMDEQGNVTPVDNVDSTVWKANGAGNGETKWENGETGGATWSGGEFIGTYKNDNEFQSALQAKKEIDGVWYITDAKGYTYPLPKDIKDAVITYLNDRLSKVDSDADGYTTDSLSFSSDDYFFLCIEYYMPMGGTGKDIYGKPDPGTQEVCKVYRMIARKGSAFGSGLHSENIDNGDMLCWTDINGNCNLEIEYNSRSDTGDNTRGRPTLEKLTYTGGALRTYLSGIGLSGEHLDADVAYWQRVQADPHMAELIEKINNAPNSQQMFNELFDWSVAARTGGIRVGDMFNNMQAKGGGGALTDGYYAGNVTKTANNYYIPTLSEDSTAGDGLVINNYLGNNGRLEVANATLMVTKTLVAPDGFTLTEEQQNETFNYQLYVQGLTGERLAQRLKWNPFSQSWQKRVESLDILTDNSSLLIDTNGSRALFCCADDAEPRQIVEVVEDGTPKYYYADATGAATNELCKDSPEHFYYIYLPGSAGDLNNYHLFASTYEGTTKLDGVGTTAYYPDGTDASKLKGDNENQTFAPAVTGQADPLDNRPAGSREYWTKQAELIPYSEVTEDAGDWEYNAKHASSYKEVEEPFTLVTVIPDPEGTDSTVYSPFSSRTQYMTTPLYFGYKAELAEHLETEGETFATCDELSEYGLEDGDLYDQIIPSVDRPDLFGDKNNQEIAKNTAEFTLKHGEGLLFTGLRNRIAYRFTEKLTKKQMNYGYTLKEISHVQQRGSDSIYRPGVQEIPVYSSEGATFNSKYYPSQFRDKKTAYGLTWAIKQGTTTVRDDIKPKLEPFDHTNAVMWEYYATMGAAELGNHHHPADSAGEESSNFFTYEGVKDGIDTYEEHKDVPDEVESNPSCTEYDPVNNPAGCDVKQDDGSVRHYMYREGVLIDPHYEGEASAYLRFMSRGVVSPTVHFGIADEKVANGPATNPESGYYDYTGVYSTFGNTGYFTEQANYTNTIDPEMMVLTKKLVDDKGNEVQTPPNQEFEFTLEFKPDDTIAPTDTTLYYWKGDRRTMTGGQTWTDDTGEVHRMPESAPKLSEYANYLTGEFTLMPLTPDSEGRYTISLKADEAAVFYGMLAGMNYTVTEKADSQYPVVNPVTPGTEPTEGNLVITGTIKRAQQNPVEITPLSVTVNRADFTNLMQGGSLTVEKRIMDDDRWDVNKTFEFTITLAAEEGKFLSSSNLTVIQFTKAKDETETQRRLDDVEWKETRDTDDNVTELTAIFTLKHGERIFIDGIPYGTKYKVAESNRNGYYLEHVADNSDDEFDENGGHIDIDRTNDSVNGTVTKDNAEAYLLFINARPLDLPFTGSLNVWMLYGTGAVVLTASFFAVFAVRCRKRGAM